MSTISSYVGDGSTTQFDITFDYNDDSEAVKAKVGGVETLFTFVNPSRVEFETAPASGVEVRIYRRTDVTTARVDFEDGAIIRAPDLDAAIAQARLRTEELGSEVDDVNVRAIKVPLGEAEIVLPSPGDRANKFLSFLPDGTIFMSAGSGTDTGLREDLANAADIVGLALGGRLKDGIKFITAAMAGIPDDGDEDDDVTVQLQGLAAAGALHKLPLQLAARTYRVSEEIEFFTSVRGEGADTVIQSTVTTAGGPIVRMSGQGSIENLTIDGNVSADPSPWNSGNYDSFTGSQGLCVGSIGSPVSGVSVKNVAVRNVRHAAFKVEIESDNVSFENCNAERMRGTFGDGFIAMGARQISYKNCSAEDYTRIGFVADTYGDSPGTYCDQISYENCRAEDGHDASILYSGGEYNAGFWSEKSGTVSFLNSVALDPGSRGFVFATGEEVNGQNSSEFTATNCSTNGADTGFLVQALADVSIKAQLVNCSVTTNGTTAYAFSAGTARDNLQMINCAAALSGTGPARSSVKAGPGTLMIDGFNETWEVVNTSYRDDANEYYASLGHFANASGKVVVRDWKTYDNAGSQIPSVFKFLSAAASSLNLNVERCYLRGVQIVGAKLTTRDVDWQRLGSIDVSDITMRGGSTLETASAFSIVIRSTTKRIRFIDMLFDLNTSAQVVNFFNLSNVTPVAKLSFQNCEFIKNFETGGSAVSLTMAGGAAGTIAGTTGASHIFANDNIFTNTGSTTANPIFNIDSNTDAGGKLHGRGNLKSSTITNPVNGTKLGTAASFEAWG